MLPHVRKSVFIWAGTWSTVSARWSLTTCEFCLTVCCRCESSETLVSSLQFAFDSIAALFVVPTAEGVDNFCLCAPLPCIHSRQTSGILKLHLNSVADFLPLCLVFLQDPSNLEQCLLLNLNRIDLFALPLQLTEVLLD